MDREQHYFPQRDPTLINNSSHRFSFENKFTSPNTPQIGHPLLQIGIFTVTLFRVLCYLVWHLKNLNCEARRELITNICHMPRPGPCISDALSPLIKSWHYTHFAYEKVEVLGSHLSKAPQLVSHRAKHSSSRTRTTTLQSEIRAPDSNYSQILWWSGFGEWQQKKIITPFICSAFYKFSHAYLEQLTDA